MKYRSGAFDYRICDLSVARGVFEFLSSFAYRRQAKEDKITNIDN